MESQGLLGPPKFCVAELKRLRQIVMAQQASKPPAVSAIDALMWNDLGCYPRKWRREQGQGQQKVR
jgi:hypothetical protein